MQWIGVLVSVNTAQIKNNIEMLPLIWTLLVTLCVLDTATCQGTNNNVTEARLFLEEFNTNFERLSQIYFQKSYESIVNITNTTTSENVIHQTIRDTYVENMSKLALQFNTSDLSPLEQRQFKFLVGRRTNGTLNETSIQELATVISTMGAIYDTSRTCVSPDKCLDMMGVIILFAMSRDHSQLADIWAKYRNATGLQYKHLYPRYVELKNEKAMVEGYADAGEQWKSVYESDTFEQDMRKVYHEVQPFFMQLHAYVRKQLKKIYPKKIFPKTGHIPAHLLGGLWAAHYSNIDDILKPFPNKPSLVDPTAELIKRNYTVEKLVRLAEEFYVSLGFDKMVPKFWNLSVFEDPKDGRKIGCHPRAHTFFDKTDYRISMCSSVHYSQLLIAHHEMGHIHYYMQYSDQPPLFRDGANEGFHEAIGDVIDMSARTPEHMLKLGLIQENVNDYETEINNQMDTALFRIAILPFTFILDQWRYSVFRGQTTPAVYNRDWWRLLCRYHGMSPPVRRSENDFDPGAIYHMAADFSFMRYFFSFVAQYQFHEALCKAACHTGPLHKCDIYNSTGAGKLLRDVLKLGRSEPWQDVMDKFTGYRRLSAKPLIRYFQPLYDWLKKQNGPDVGWDTNNC